VDEAGRPVEHAGSGGDRAVTLVASDAQPVAALVHDAVLLEDPGLVNGLIAAVRLSINNEKLQGRIKAQLDDVGRVPVASAYRSRRAATQDRT
jgi:hypothetical protein